jgi:hypothetical protein
VDEPYRVAGLEANKSVQYTVRVAISSKLEKGDAPAHTGSGITTVAEIDGHRLQSTNELAHVNS